MSEEMKKGGNIPRKPQPPPNFAPEPSDIPPQFEVENISMAISEAKNPTTLAPIDKNRNLSKIR